VPPLRPARSWLARSISTPSMSGLAASCRCSRSAVWRRPARLAFRWRSGAGRRVVQIDDGSFQAGPVEQRALAAS
jgi:hypothetical protein